MKNSRMIKKIVSVAIVSFAVISLVGCASKEEAKTTKADTEVNKEEEVPQLVSYPQNDVIASNDKLPVATIKVKDYGEMKLELYPSIAPNTVNNFISLANKGFYNGLNFHRIIDKFMVQGGDPQGNGTGGPGYSIKGEFSTNNFPNKLLHKVGIISMARSAEANSAGSQFFIMTADAPHLDGNYAAFGRIIDGLDVLTKLSKVKTDKNNNDKPLKDVVVESISVDTKGIQYNEPEKIK
jgi:peptidyl-prolyl cis-trans isomerase B (cyclophilin B)